MRQILRSPVIAALILALGLMISAQILSESRVHLAGDEGTFGDAIKLDLGHGGAVRVHGVAAYRYSSGSTEYDSGSSGYGSGASEYDSGSSEDGSGAIEDGD